MRAEIKRYRIHAMLAEVMIAIGLISILLTDKIAVTIWLIGSAIYMCAVLRLPSASKLSDAMEENLITGGSYDTTARSIQKILNSAMLGFIALLGMSIPMHHIWKLWLVIVGLLMITMTVAISRKAMQVMIRI